MKGKGFLIVIIVILVILNLGTLTFIWIHRPGNNEIPMKQRNAAEFLTRELNMTSSQKEQFRLLRENHRMMMQAFQRKEQDMHNRFFDLLLSFPADSSLVRQIADSMALTRRNMEMLTFDHFRKIRQILTGEQKKKFDDIFHETLKLVLPPLPPPPPPPPPAPASGR